MIEVVAQRQTGDGEMVITVASANREETQGGDARKRAIHTATQYIGKCGFNAMGDWGYLNPPTAEHPEGVPLTENELLVPGAMKAGGKFLQDIRVRCGI